MFVFRNVRYWFVHGKGHHCLFSVSFLNDVFISCLFSKWAGSSSRAVAITRLREAAINIMKCMCFIENLELQNRVFTGRVHVFYKKLRT